MGAETPLRVFCDANILFSASKPRSAIRRLVQALLKRKAAVTSRYAIAEAEANLRAKKPNWLPHWLVLRRRFQLHDVRAEIRVRGLPEKALPIAQAAVSATATHLLTGDRKHFGSLMGKSVRGVKVVSPRMLVTELDALGWTV